MQKTYACQHREAEANLPTLQLNTVPPGSFREALQQRHKGFNINTALERLGADMSILVVGFHIRHAMEIVTMMMTVESCADSRRETIDRPGAPANIPHLHASHARNQPRTPRSMQTCQLVFCFACPRSPVVSSSSFVCHFLMQTMVSLRLTPLRRLFRPPTSPHRYRLG